MRIEQAPENRVEQHASWIAVNPVIGCPYGCEYCFLGPDELRPMRPEELQEPAETIEDLLDSKYYTPDIPVAIGTRTDMFATPKNKSYVKEWLGTWKEAELKNPLVFITKGEIPEDIAQTMGEMRACGSPIVVFLSISGLDNSVEKGVKHDKLIGNITRLADYNVPAVHYWRPLMPQNSTPETMKRTQSLVAGKTTSSFVGGLRLTEEMKKQITNWPDILEVDTENLDSVWDHGGFGYVSELRTLKPDHPIYEAVSCNMAIATGAPEYNGVYGTELCQRSNCPEEQRAICSTAIQATELEVTSALDRLGYPDANFTIQDNSVSVEQPLPVDILTNLIHSTRMNVQVPQATEDGYGWGNHHTRKPVFIGGEQLAVKKPNKLLGFSLNQLQDLQKDFKTLKERFALTEKQEWNALVVAGELNLQCAHLNLTVNHETMTERYAPQLESPQDEVADILFNTLNTLSFLGKKVDQKFIDDVASYTPNSDSWMSELQTLAGLTWDAIAKKTGYKSYVNDREAKSLNINELLASVLACAIYGAEKLNILNAVNFEIGQLATKSQFFINDHGKKEN